MNAKLESEKLMNAVLTLAEKMLRQYGEFYPYGGYMTPGGEIIDVGAKDPTTNHPKSEDLIQSLRSSFRALASEKKCKAVALVFDVAVVLPNSTRKSDAIQVCVDHVDGYSAEVFFPYHIVNNEIVYDVTFAQEGEYRIFEQK
ncbi:MAG TPA: hypothetical protein VN025_15935 [Candidatus Dormibacteraeota bacterium]|jgi:hypothetical protein|nr:hypothetical protein [Candidatus Dormibacteraeota bacterium]